MGKINATLGLWQDRPAEEAFETAAAADRLGFEELWIGEMATFDAFSLATAIGLQNRRITPALGPFAVSVRTPVNIAVGAATVSAAIGRPINIALGTSSNVVVSEWHGQPRERPAQRLEESTQVVSRLLKGEKVDFTGETLSTQGYHLRLPAPGSSVAVAAFGQRAIQIAASHGDRVLLNMVTVESARKLCAQVADAAAAAGRPKPPVALWLATSVDPTGEDTKQMIRSKTGYLAAPGYSDMFIEAGFGDLVALAKTRPHPKELRAAMPDEELAAVTCLTGSVGDVEARINDYFAAGVDEICIVPTTAGDPGGVRTLTAVSKLL
ncbi:putative F420-dependent oxidoreductase [Arthrobacter ginsengisoli]|uniref:F420-dependent oxidoreductase n=1 Tax=Arthrobacter ginsengisoli TaxID=1356565 RepID=A0ABU1UG27_9MICC|nr:LLM class F420-dependent oxidoreductase [Arthrobacter ginsengisoli]MDR7084151.1 putative F420-dependent oxidoreductase [Arthrobacter ginsengisoli]